jgi:hypothetical protein
MAYIGRALEKELREAARNFSAIILTGPRRAGKTTLLRHLRPHASYWLLEDPEVVARVRADPRAFLDELRVPAILDEIQNVPEILNHVRARIDSHPEHKGDWLLTGSQEAPLMRGVTESMAGRAASCNSCRCRTPKARRSRFCAEASQRSWLDRVRPRCGSARTFRHIWNGTSGT